LWLRITVYGKIPWGGEGLKNFTECFKAIGKNMKEKKMGQNIHSQNLVFIISQPKVLGLHPNVLQ
jgi:hypothetical protein